MKKFIYILFSVVLLSSFFYFSQNRMALEILKTEDQNLKTEFEFSDDHQLTNIIMNNQTLTFKLDENNRRKSKIINGKVVEKYLWQGDEKLYIVTDSQNNVLREYLYKTKYDTLPYGMKVNNKIYHFIFNKMRTLRVVLSDKKIVKTLAYDKNGFIVQDSNPSLKVDFSYAGGLIETNSKLLFFVEGVYDTKNGFWVTRIKNDDVIDNLKLLSKLPKNEVYLCSDTLDTYYHSYLCTNGSCGGFYAIDYMNYFNGRGTMSDNSKYFHPKRCELIHLENSIYDQNKFSTCVENKIQSKRIKMFDALSHNCHHEVEEIINSCKKISKREEI